MSPAAANPPKIPELELIEKIGSGGYGEVWLCRNALGALRAVKIVRRAEFDDERPYEREFNGIRKFEPISRTHEGLVDLLQVGRNDSEGWFYYVMELADNANGSNYSPRTLASEVKTRGALPLDECLAIGLQLASALAELHRHDLVHRDIKPSNIIFVGGAPKLADIGLVATASESRSFVGTEGFIPPEGPGTARADIYSLGIILYVLATGKHHRDFPEPPTDLATRRDRAALLELTAIIHKATQTNPRDRYESAEALLADLQRFKAGQSIKLRHSMLQKFSWAWKAALAITLAGAAWLVIHQQQTQPKPIFDMEEISSFEKSGTTNVLAWEMAVRGKALAGPMMAAGMSNGIVQCEQSVILDPNFAYAWQHLAGLHNLFVDKGFAHGSNHIERAQFCAQRAIELNPERGFAWHWLAYATLAADYDFQRAEPIFLKAIAIMPKNPPLRHNYAIRLWCDGRSDEAEEMLRGVLREDPSIAYSHSVLGQIASSRGDYELALRELNECILLAPAGPDPYFERFEILWLMNRKAEALSDLWRCMELDGFGAISREDSLLHSSRSRNEAPAQTLSEILQRLEKRRAEGQFVSSFDLARLYALLENKTSALDSLERAVEEHRLATLSAKVRPVFKELRDEPRYHAVLRRLRLEN